MTHHKLQQKLFIHQSVQKEPQNNIRIAAKNRRGGRHLICIFSKWPPKCNYFTNKHLLIQDLSIDHVSILGTEIIPLDMGTLDHKLSF